MLARLEWIKDISIAACEKRAKHVGNHPWYKDGYWSGMSASSLYEPRQAKYKKLLSKRQRELILSEVIAILKRGRLSSFEHEAAVRYGLRLRFIGEGHSWAHSDLEAAAILDRAFISMGVARPSWEAGQPNWSISHDFCQTCCSPLDDADTANHKRFCSDNCAKVMKSWDHERHYRVHTYVMHHARYVAKLSEVPGRPCAVCGTGFKSVDPEASTCSPSCTGIAKRKVPERNCKHCSKLFRPHTIVKGGDYCSKSCADQSRRLKPKPCKTCLSHFAPAYNGQEYCSTSCFISKPGMNPRPCNFCGNEFSPRKFDTAKFCSSSCKDKAKNRERSTAMQAARTFSCNPC